MVGDIPQEGTDRIGLESVSTPNSGSPSTKEETSGNSRRCEAAEAAAKEGRTPVCTKEDGKLTKRGVGERAGIVPRAVEDIFRLVRQGGVWEGKSGAPLHAATPQNDRRDPQSTTPTAATAATAADAASSTRIGCRSATSSRSSSSDGSSSGQVPSAAHWPLAESTLYVPRAQIPNREQLPSGVPPAFPSRDPEKSNTTGNEEVGGDEEKMKTLQEDSAVRATSTCECAVQCSYMQVRARRSEASSQETGRSCYVLLTQLTGRG